MNHAHIYNQTLNLGTREFSDVHVLYIMYCQLFSSNSNKLNNRFNFGTCEMKHVQLVFLMTLVHKLNPYKKPGYTIHTCCLISCYIINYVHWVRAICEL